MSEELFSKLLKKQKNGNIYLINKHKICFEIDVSYNIIWVSSDEIMFNHIYKNLLSDEPNKIISELILKYFNINVNDYKLFVF